MLAVVWLSFAIPSFGAIGFVSVNASSPLAHEEGASPGIFTFTRTGATTADLVVKFSIGGTAAAGADYETITNRITIPAGTNAVALLVTPIDDADLEAAETVTVLLSDDPAYLIGFPDAATVTIVDNDNQPPAVSILSPTNGQFFPLVPTNIMVTVSVADPEGNAARVEFYNRGLKIGVSSNAPFSYLWANAPAGTNQLRAVAFDSVGASNISAVVEFRVNQAPQVGIVTPTNNARFAPGSSIPLQVAADDAEGLVTRLALYVNGALTIQVFTNSFSMALDPPSPGAYQLLAVAEDQWGALGTSAPVNLTVQAPGPALFDDFEPNIDLSQWSAFGGVVGSTIRATNYGGWVSPSNSLWFGADTNRFIVSRALDTRQGGRVSFNLRLANSYEPWEQADVPGEGVVLEYSTNGTVWSQLGSYDSTEYYNWTLISREIPAAAQAAQTYFRWRQISHSGSCCDHWALDDVEVYVGPTPPSISTQPAGVTVLEGAEAVFSVLAGGSPPLFYQWRANGSNLPNATNATLRLLSVTTNMSGWNFSVAVSNAMGGVISTNARLTVVSLGEPLFQVLALRTNGSAIVDHDAITGDDRGGIAVSGSQVFIQGDSAMARYSAANLSNGLRVSRIYDGLVSDLRTEKLYTLANGTNPVSSGSVVNGLLEINGADGSLTTNRIILSPSLSLTTYSYGNVGLFSGYGHIVVHTGTRVYNISLPGGQVTDLGAMAAPTHISSENWAYWGIAERVGSLVNLVYVQTYTNIARTRVPDGATSTISTFANLGDMASITLSPSRGRWYFHYEGSAQFGYGSEILGYADADVLIGNFAPTVVAQPRNQFVVAGGNARFEVLASGGATLAYQWLFEGEEIPGANAPSLAVNNVQSPQVGNYQVVVSNPQGAVTSAVATLSIGSAPYIITPPENQELLAGMDLNLFGEAIGVAPLDFQWWFNGEILPGATNAVLTIAGAEWRHTGQYFFTVSNGLGVVTSTVAEVTVLSPPFMLQDPVDVRVSPGDTARFYAVVGGTPPFDFQWYHNDAPLPGATEENLTLPLAGAEEAGAYYLVAENDFGMVTSAVATLGWATLFKINALLTNNSKYYDHNTQTGDDNGCIAASKTHVFYSGDSATARFTLSSLGGAASLGRVYEALVSNLRTETVYSLAAGTNLYTGYGVVSNLLELDGVTLQPVGRSIPLSVPITNYNSYNNLLCSGVDRVVWVLPSQYYSGRYSNTVYLIDLPSGRVTTTLVTNLAFASSENWASWGIAEYFDSSVHLVYVASSTAIRRTRLSDGTTSTLATFQNLSDMACITVSIPANRWYFHHEYGSQFTGQQSPSETIGFADARFMVVDRTNNEPVFLEHPASLTVSVGGTARFSNDVAAIPPVRYQWQFWGTNLPGATNAVLALANAKTNHAGPYAVVVTDALGEAVSSNAWLTVNYGYSTNQMLVFGVTDHAWSYNQSGADLGVAWRETNYNDSAWPSGTGLLANEDDPPMSQYIGTSLNLSNQVGQKITTFYFRTRFVLPPIPGAIVLGLVSSNLVDDGAVFYLNGLEQARVRMNTGTIYSTNFANTSAPEGVYTNLALPGPFAPPGATNWLAVEVHQNSATSSDIVFGLALFATYGVPNSPPVLLSQPVSQTVIPGDPVAFSGSATGQPQVAYFWLKDGTPVSGATNAMLQINNAQAAHAGLYALVASNVAGAVTSRTARLTVLAPPEILSQPQGILAPPGANVLLQVGAAGMAPLGFHWFRNGQPVAGNSAILVLNGINSLHVGDYYAVVSNVLGCATSAVANVAVIAPGFRTTAGALALSNGVFRLRFDGYAGAAYLLEGSADLARWELLQTFTNAGMGTDFWDWSATNHVRRFYRLRLSP